MKYWIKYNVFGENQGCRISVGKPDIIAGSQAASWCDNQDLQNAGIELPDNFEEEGLRLSPEQYKKLEQVRFKDHTWE